MIDLAHMANIDVKIRGPREAPEGPLWSWEQKRVHAIAKFVQMCLLQLNRGGHFIKIALC